MVDVKPYVIHQLLPADGWGARYHIGGVIKEGYVLLIGWAIISYGDGDREIVGMVADKGEIVEARSLEGFQAYDRLPSDKSRIAVHY